MMTGLEATRELLPTSVVWGPVFVYVPAAFVVSFLSAELGARISLRPLRQARDPTWAERARLAHPARVVARTNAILLPALHGGVILAVPQALCGLSAALFAFLLVLASFAGTVVVSVRVERCIRQGQYTFGQHIRAVSVLWLLFRGPALVLIALLLLMPATFNARAWLLLIGGAAAILLFAVGGGFYIVWLLGLVKPASARLQGIVSNAAGSMEIPVRGVHELAFPVANAVAFPFLGQLERVSARCSVNSASRRAYPGGINPPARYTKMKRALERRADRLAKEQQTQQGVFARALLKIHEANLSPVVEPGKGTTHPHLHDRLVAVGAPPDFPRPKPPSQFRARLGMAVTLLVLLAAWIGLIVARFSFAPRGGDERAIFRSLALGGRSAVDLSDLALVRWRANRLTEAVVLYQADSEIDPDSPFLPANQAIVLAALGRCEEADIAAREAQRRHEREPRLRGETVVRTAREAVLGCFRKEQR